jgi:aldose 1-epimerase
MPSHRSSYAVLWVAALASLVACSKKTPEPAPAPEQPPAPTAEITRQSFGQLPDGTQVELFTLRNASGLEVQVTNYGGIITSIKTPDREGKLADITLGHASLEPYLDNTPYFGAIVGRYANRIGKAQFKLDGKTYKLPANDGPNTLHGGTQGFDKAVWKAETFERPGEVGLVLTHTSPDGDQGFPGNLSVRVTYTLNDRNELALDYHATTDKPTVVNLTQHPYFNLAGEGSGDVRAHEVLINASRYTPVDKTLIPTGKLESVENTPLDFRTAKPIGQDLASDHPQMKLAGGYDHNFVIDREGPGLVLAAHVEEPVSGRVMEIHTTEPGVQFYTGNFLDGSIVGKSGRPYIKHGGLCLETQHFPDSPNKPSFPSTTLRPGEEYTSRTVYTFSTL